MYNYAYAVIILIVITLLYIINLPCKTNILRHMTNEYNYAHYSEITKATIYKYPSLLLTNPYYVTLQAGECLWIPKNWWHWVISSKSIAVNFWCDDTEFNDWHMPKQYKSKIDNTLFLDKLNAYNNTITMWDSVNDIVDEIASIKEMVDDNKYIITVDGYTNEKKYNAHLHDTLKDDIIIPNIFADKKVEKNIWISSGYQDSGLHHDDNHGLLCVLQGTKNITLYPPSDSKYLHAMCILPIWAKCQPVQFEYNIYDKISDLPADTNLPSARLLYESIMAYNNKQVLQYISNCNTDTNTLVWGCKLHNGVVRWEFYAYYLYNVTKKLDTFATTPQQLATITKCKKLNTDIIIHSYDLYNTDIPLQETIHFYHKRNNNITLPFYGYGTNITNNHINVESVYVIDTQSEFIKNYEKYTIKLKIIKNKCKILLNAYNCKHICIFKKNNTDIFIMYFGISVNDFILFLQAHKYPQQLVTHVVENKNKYANICHEIAIVYDILTLQPIRSAFYGIV